MEVILREEVENLGTRGQVVNVRSGYARNFLLPRRLAVPATGANKKIVEQERQSWLKKEAKLASEAQELANLLTPIVITIKQKAGENDQLFGSVTAKDIADALAAQKFEIDRKKIVLDEPIRHLGEFKVNVKLHRDVTAPVTVKVEKEEEEA
jgi:large subunit ribosomal protein L9